MSNVKAAVGSEKQFSPQPRDLYQKNLQGLSGNIRVDVDASTKSQDLARSLGVLGNAVEAEFISKEKNKEKIGIYDAEKVIEGRSEEDLKKLSAIELLHSYGGMRSADNPYAVVTVEKMRGKYLGARAKTEYDVWRKDQPPVKEASEEVARYTKYVQDNYGEVSGVATDQEAFQKGFYDTFIPDQKEKADNFIKEKSTEMDITRKGMALAKISEIIENANNLTPQELQDSIAKVFKEGRLAGQLPKDKFELAGYTIDKYASLWGNREGLQQLLTNTPVGVDPTTYEPVMLGNYYPAHDAYRMAEIRETHVKNEALRKKQDPLKKLTIPELYAHKDTLYATDIKEFNVMAPFIDTLITEKEKAEKEQKITQMQKDSEGFVKKEMEMFIYDQLEARSNNWTRTAMGAPRYDSLGAIPPFHYKTLDSSGKVIDKEIKVTQEMMDTVVWREVQRLEQDTSLSTEEQFNHLYDLFGWGLASGAKEMYKNTITSALSTITPDQKMTPQLQRSLDLYQASPEQFHELFNKEASSTVAAIVTLGNSRGNFEEGIMLYATTKDKRNDEKLMAQVKKDINQQITLDTTLKGFVGLDGGAVNITTSLSSNSAIRQQVEELATTLMLAGRDANTAVKESLESVKKVNYVYRGTAVPKSIFNEFPVENKGDLGKRTLDHMVINYCTSKGLEESFAYVEWDYTRNQLVINNDARYDINDIQWEASERLKELQAEWEKQKTLPEYQDVTLEELKKPKDITLPGWEGIEIDTNQ